MNARPDSNFFRNHVVVPGTWGAGAPPPFGGERIKAKASSDAVCLHRSSVRFFHPGPGRSAPVMWNPLVMSARHVVAPPQSPSSYAGSRRGGRAGVGQSEESEVERPPATSKIRSRRHMGDG